MHENMQSYREPWKVFLEGKKDLSVVNVLQRLKE
jgi:hypothetical protein